MSEPEKMVIVSFEVPDRCVDELIARAAEVAMEHATSVSVSDAPDKRTSTRSRAEAVEEDFPIYRTDLINWCLLSGESVHTASRVWNALVTRRDSASQNLAGNVTAEMWQLSGLQVIEDDDALPHQRIALSGKSLVAAMQTPEIRELSEFGPASMEFTQQFLEYRLGGIVD